MPSLSFDYPDILEVFAEYSDPKRSESAAFLIWYLENYYRLDPDEAVDYVCDQMGDKGIDGIYVDDDLQTIYVFQARLSQKQRTVGDTALKEFAGTLAQLSDPESVQNLVTSAGKADVARLLERLDIETKVTDYDVRGEFVCNMDLDANGEAFLQQHAQHISVTGPTALRSGYVPGQRDVPIATPVSFDVSAFQVTEYAVDTDVKAFIAPIRARQLVALDGIADQSLFTHNVRGPLGKTKVNRDIVRSIGEPDLHKQFPLFHNGITVIAGDVSVSDSELTVADYFVVNGCQSLTALHRHSNNLTDDLYVLTKFIKVNPESSLATQITEYSNNQNGVKPRDFKANSGPQIRLQNEFRGIFNGTFGYEIKRGDPESAQVVVSNEDAGLYLMAFDLKEPWATHRKYQVFDERHADIFSRPAVTADRIVMLHICREEIDRQVNQINNGLFGKYVLTRYLLLYVVRGILENDTVGQQVIDNPQRFIRASEERERFRACVGTVLNDIIIDLNAEIDDLGEDFDYRGRLRDQDWVKELGRRLVGDYQKLVARGRIPSFSEDWASKGGSQG